MSRGGYWKLYTLDIDAIQVVLSLRVYKFVTQKRELFKHSSSFFNSNNPSSLLISVIRTRKKN